MPGTDGKYQQRFIKSANLYKPCTDCKKKRTLCVRVRRKHNLGHASLSVHETLPDGSTTKPTTYALWPKKGGVGRNETDLRRDDPGDDPANTGDWDPKDTQCKEIDEQQEQKLKEAVNKPEQYNFLNGNYCSTWAGGTYNGITGSNVGTFTPGTMAESINPTPMSAYP